jgi:hypothetical protein
MLLGGLGHVTGGGGFDAFARFVQPLGALWLSGLQAIVLPLIMTQMVLAVADTPADVGVARLGRRALVLLPTLLVAAGVAGVVATPSITAAVTSARRRLDRRPDRPKPVPGCQRGARPARAARLPQPGRESRCVTAWTSTPRWP